MKYPVLIMAVLYLVGIWIGELLLDWRITLGSRRNFGRYGVIRMPVSFYFSRN